MPFEVVVEQFVECAGRDEEEHGIEGAGAECDGGVVRGGGRLRGEGSGETRRVGKGGTRGWDASGRRQSEIAIRADDGAGGANGGEALMDERDRKLRGDAPV